MKEAQLKTTLGIFLIIAHFGIITLIVAFWFSDYFLFDEMTTSIALIVPMFAIYTTVIIRNIIADKHPTAGGDSKVTGSFAFISFFIPSLFTVFIAAMIVLKGLNVGFDTFEQFKIMLGLTETIFALYVGLIINSLFTERKKKASSISSKRPPPEGNSISTP